MSVYRVCWLTAALLLGLVGLSAAIVLLKAALLILLPLFAVVGVLVAAMVVTSSAEAAPCSRSRRVCRVALLWGAAGGAMAGFFELVGPLGLLVAVLLAATSPRSFRACLRGMAALRRPTAAQVDALARSLACMNPMYVPFELTFDLRLLTDRQLANAWRNSEAAVSSPSDPRAAMRAVEERGRYLDEFERRQPSLLRAWLASDAGAPDGPLPFATASRRESPTIDWDELIGGQATDR